VELEAEEESSHNISDEVSHGVPLNHSYLKQKGSSTNTEKSRKIKFKKLYPLGGFKERVLMLAHQDPQYKYLEKNILGRQLSYKPESPEHDLLEDPSSNIDEKLSHRFSSNQYNNQGSSSQH